MKIIIELPTWLGDSVMATPAIENLGNLFNDVEITLIGPTISIEALKNNPKVSQTHILDRNYIHLYKTLKNFGEFDLFLSFRGSLRTRFIKFFVLAKKKYQYDKNKFNEGHQVEKFNNFINDCLNINQMPSRLTLHNNNHPKDKKHKLLGINPGASYGSAKRWLPKNFADVAIELSRHYDIIIFGGAEEQDIAADIEDFLIQKGVVNYKNLSNKTNINELISQISNLDLFITGDSGPMHLAAALMVPTVAIFGPTKDQETSQWMNEKSLIVKKNLACQPCMKRVCPLKHHNCMKFIDASDVLKAVKKINQF
jgi:heptosyltransferase II